MSSTELEHVRGVWQRMKGNSPIYVRMQFSSSFPPPFWMSSCAHSNSSPPNISEVAVHPNFLIK